MLWRGKIRESKNSNPLWRFREQNIRAAEENACTVG